MRWVRTGVEIDERWFSSTTNAANGPGTPEDEGLSYLAFNGQKVFLKEAIELLGDKFLGGDVMTREGGWNILCSFSTILGRSLTTCTSTTSMRSSLAPRQTGGKSISRLNIISSRITSPTPLWDSSQGRHRRHRSMLKALERRR